MWVNKSNQLAPGGGLGRGEGNGLFAAMFLRTAPRCLVCCNKPGLQAFLKESTSESLILKRPRHAQKHCLVGNYPLNTGMQSINICWGPTVSSVLSHMEACL